MFGRKKRKQQENSFTFETPKAGGLIPFEGSNLPIIVPANRAVIKIYLDKRKGWRWSLIARNGKIMADSAEGYVSKRNAIKAADKFKEIAPRAEVEEV